MNPILYPKAKWMNLQGHSGPGTLAAKNTIVMHITEGPTAAGAYAAFAGSVYPNRVSAHLIVDRDGSCQQVVDLRDTAWHASQVNQHAIGIEHVAISKAGAADLNRKHAAAIAAGQQQPFVEMLATDAQYESSARLVAWLCKLLGVPCDRSHVRTHNEASPADFHVFCCSGALFIDRVVLLAKGYYDEE